LNPELSAAMARASERYHHALKLFANEHVFERWRAAMHACLHDARVAKSILGAVLRLLHDQQWLPIAQTALVFSRELTPPASTDQAGAFIEHFLQSGAEILLHDQALLGLLDAWLMELEADSFIALLPVLRRAFADFEAHQRSQILQLLARDPRVQSKQGLETELDPAVWQQALPLLRVMLGIKL
jgi:hypothetical protein